MLPVPPPSFPPPLLPAPAVTPAITAMIATAHSQFPPPFSDFAFVGSPGMSFFGVGTDSGLCVVISPWLDRIISPEYDTLVKLMTIVISIMLTINSFLMYSICLFIGYGKTLLYNQGTVKVDPDLPLTRGMGCPVTAD